MSCKWLKVHNMLVSTIFIHTWAAKNGWGGGVLGVTITENTPTLAKNAPPPRPM